MKKKNWLLVLSLTVNILVLSLSALLLPKKGLTSFLLSNKALSQSTNLTKSPVKFSDYYLDRNSLFELLTRSQDDIIFLGDSLTNRCEWSELFEKANIKNRGINGDNTYGLLNRIEQITASRPKKIFIMIGINDIIPNEDIEKITYKYRLILKTIKQSTPDTQVFVQSVLPVNNRRKWIADNNKVIALNEKLILLTKEFHDEYIDLYTMFSTDNQLTEQYTNDGIHLNGDGYLVWKQGLSKYIY